MPTNKLTARFVQTVKPLDKPKMYGDGAGLYLRVMPTGSRQWVHVFHEGGKRRERGLGSPPSVSLAEAREKRDRATGAPVAEPVRVVPTFGAFADQLVADLTPSFKNEKHRQQWENTLKTDAASLRDIPIDRVSTGDVLACLKPIWTEKNETATRLRGRIERVLDAAAVAGWRDPDKKNPAAWKGHLKLILPTRGKHEKGHHSAMPYDDLPAFWRSLPESVESARALKFTILTCCRTNEVLGGGPHEIKGDVWTIPKERMKAGVEHDVLLTEEAKRILGGKWFAGRHGKPLSDMAMLEYLRGRFARKYTVHGFRSAARDYMADKTDFPEETCEMMLAHTVGGAVRAAYRRGKGLDKRWELARAWEAYLLGAEVKKEAA